MSDIMIAYFESDLRKIESFDKDEARKEYSADESNDRSTVNAMIIGAMSFYLSESIKLNQKLLKEYKSSLAKHDVLEMSVEAALEEEEELLARIYGMSDVVQNAQKKGMEREEILKRLADIEDDELENERFIDKSERCIDCEDLLDAFCAGGLCEGCSETYEESRVS